MKKIVSSLILTVALFFAANCIGQSTITGKITDPEMNFALTGVTITEKGTTKSVLSDYDGKFSLTTENNTGEISISYIGYTKQTIPFSKSEDLGEIFLSSSQVGLKEVRIISSVAVDRKTPVAVSTIKAEDIALKLSTQEFPEILKATPGIYATRAGGGYGDGRVNIRGFSSENVAVMINGVPVNDMENGAVYWSNWAGLGDVTSTMQVQRGLGASKVAVPSIGGTINVITKTTDVEEGGNIAASIANNNYQKYGMTYSTGLSKKGFAATVSAAKISGDGYVDGTAFSGFNYFLNLSQQLNQSNRLSFSAFGAQQEHGQRYNRGKIADLENTQSGPKQFNKDWGIKSGKAYSTAFNFYHKPQMSLNHLWEINNKSVLSTSAYASFGSGGGRRTSGSKFSNDQYRIGGVDQPIDIDQIVDENRANGIAGATDIIASSRNSHQWYGLLSTYKNDINEKLRVSGGLDARYYVGSHWYQVDDLLGGLFFTDPKTTKKTYGKALKVGDRYNKDYDGIVTRGGLFLQGEYQVNDKANLFIATDISNTNYQKEEFMSNTIADNARTSDAINFVGYGIKGGGNYNLDNKNNVFVNVGYFSKAPFLNSVFLDDNTLDLNKNAQNEKVFSAEVGYGFRSERASINLNVYNTYWLDKTITSTTVIASTQERFYANLQGMDALHQGVEIDAKIKATENLSFTAMASLGNWKWKSNVSGFIRDESGEIVGKEINVFAKDLKVGDAAQTTFALGAKYKYAPKSQFYVDYNYAGNLYSSYDVTNRSKENMPSLWKVPAYGLIDLGMNHHFKFGSFEANLNGKVNNALNTTYISDANDIDGTASSAFVYYGAGRTYSIGLTLNY
ncbi:TonB-dependent receptor [Flavobacterium crassostreae]|uniref:TonB-dependent receptor n=1 Tax=Flavobacterium crassostreae TaxID=1763534 RepID=UPI0008A531DB|nr:TonB-dependent receptor plug domain-containing protein [Flavobacterium crassostreae]